MAPTNPWPKWPDPNRNTTAAAVTTQDDDTKRVLLGEYSEHGAWARHYSTVRMTLGTFFLTASIGIIYQRWDKSFDWRTVGLAAFALMIGIALFLFFSWQTYKSMNHQLAIALDYQTTLSPDATNRPPQFEWKKQPDVLYIVIGAVGFFLLALGLWWKCGQSKADPVAVVTPAPAAARYAVAYSAVHQTNHGREAHTFLVEETTGNLWQMRCTPDESVEFKGVQRDGALPAKLSGQ